MAGPGIRYTHLARVLSAHVDVTLAVPAESEDTDYATLHRYERHRWETLAPLAKRSDVVILGSDTAYEFPELAELACAIVIDGYDPLMAEWLSIMQRQPLAQQTENWALRLKQLEPQLWLGDFFVCASERQRDWWLGKLESAGRITPSVYQRDPSLRTLIDLAPYGAPATPLVPTRRMIKGVWPGIAADDILLLWGGGLWNWLDPLTAIRAVARLREQHPNLRLVFPGTRHPNPALKDMPVQVEAAQALAGELGLRDTQVFFGDWVAYRDWPNVLAESDLALSLHFDTLETRLAFRSRMFDYIWAGLPILCTEGDATSDLVRAAGIGSVIGYGDDRALAAAIEHWLSARASPGFQQAIAAAREQHSWENAYARLIEFCQNPMQAADRATARATLSNYYAGQSEMLALRRERDALSAQVSAYERGRFMRLMRWLKQGRR
jgi:hypothetical protein